MQIQNCYTSLPRKKDTINLVLHFITMQVTQTFTGNLPHFEPFFAICSNRVSDHNRMSLLFPFFSLSPDICFYNTIKPLLKRIRYGHALKKKKENKRPIHIAPVH